VKALLRELAAHATRAKYPFRVSYGVGDVVVWDNASMLHSATLTDPSYPQYVAARHHQGSAQRPLA